jgi:hypothetical protein
LEEVIILTCSYSPKFKVYENGKLRHVETIPGIRGLGITVNDGGG